MEELSRNEDAGKLTCPKCGSGDLKIKRDDKEILTTVELLEEMNEIIRFWGYGEYGNEDALRIPANILQARTGD